MNGSYLRWLTMFAFAPLALVFILMLSLSLALVFAWSGMRSYVETFVPPTSWPARARRR